MQNLNILFAVGLWALASFAAAQSQVGQCQQAQVETYGLAEKVFDASLVDVCRCCYNTSEKISARGRLLVIRPDGEWADWLLRDEGPDKRSRVSIDVFDCVAHNRGGSYPTQLVDNNGDITSRGKAVSFRLEKLTNGFSPLPAGVPYFAGYVCPFILGPPALIQAPIEPTISCKIRYCYANAAPSTPQACKVY